MAVVGDPSLNFVLPTMDWYCSALSDFVVGPYCPGSHSHCLGGCHQLFLTSWDGQFTVP